MRRKGYLLPVGIVALCGGVTAWAGAALAPDVMLAPLLILHAPTTLVMLSLRSSNWLLTGLLGAAFYAVFAACFCRARSRTARVWAAVGIIAFNVLSVVGLGFAVPRLS